MRRTFVAISLLACHCNPNYDSWDYTAEVTSLAAAEMNCPAAQLHLSPVPDRYGTHTFVITGCGCTVTYQCDNHDLNGCDRADDGHLLEQTDASCR